MIMRLDEIEIYRRKRKCCEQSRERFAPCNYSNFFRSSHNYRGRTARLRRQVHACPRQVQTFFNFTRIISAEFAASHECFKIASLVVLFAFLLNFFLQFFCFFAFFKINDIFIVLFLLCYFYCAIFMVQFRLRYSFVLRWLPFVFKE